MLYLLCGENDFRVREKIAELLSAFYAKNGDTRAVYEIDGTDSYFDQIVSLFSTSDLFSTRRMLIFKNVFENHPSLFPIFVERAESLARHSDIIIFWERALDRESELYKIFETFAQKIQHTTSRSHNELIQWMGNQEKKLGIILSSRERSMIIERAGEEKEFAIWQILERIALGDTFLDVKHEMVLENAIFGFADRIFRNRFTSSLIVASEAEKSGFEPSRFISVILWKLKNMLLVAHGGGSSLKPFVKKHATEDAAMFSFDALLTAFREGIAADADIKKDPAKSRERFHQFLLKTKDLLS